MGVYEIMGEGKFGVTGFADDGDEAEGMVKEGPSQYVEKKRYVGGNFKEDSKKRKFDSSN